MTIKKINYTHIVGIIVGLILANQSIRAITYSNYIYVFYFILLVTVTFKYLIFNHKLNIHFNIDDYVVISTYGVVLVYALLSTIVTGFENLFVTLELISLFFMYIVGRIISLNSYKISIFIIIIIGLIHSLFLIFNRAYIYASNINYLLLSLIIGLFCCISLLFCLKANQRFKQIIFFLFFIIAWWALFRMQSRAVFLFALMYSFAAPLYLLSYSIVVPFLTSNILF